MKIKMDRDWKSRDEYEQKRLEAQKKKVLNESKTFNTKDNG